jgi:hypothetical protein
MYSGSPVHNILPYKKGKRPAEQGFFLLKEER